MVEPARLVSTPDTPSAPAPAALPPFAGKQTHLAEAAEAVHGCTGRTEAAVHAPAERERAPAAPDPSTVPEDRHASTPSSRQDATDGFGVSLGDADAQDWTADAAPDPATARQVASTAATEGSPERRAGGCWSAVVLRSQWCGSQSSCGAACASQGQRHRECSVSRAARTRAARSQAAVQGQVSSGSPDVAVCAAPPLQQGA